jgi:4-amino-4-deoxy-L-arabinose transferase-like glycosyltransferase
VLGAAIRHRRSPVVRLLLAWFVVSFLVILPIANQRTRYLLPMTPPLALLVAWWSTSQIAAFRPVRWALAGLTLIAGCVMLVALGWPQAFGASEAPLEAGWRWSTVPLVVATVVFTGALAAGLYAAAPRLLMYGVIAATALALGYGIWPYTRRFNEVWDFPGLAAAVERHADGRPIGVFGGRWFALDYYLGRSVYSAQSLDEFSEYVRRPERPVMVTNGRTWRGIRASMGAELRVLDEKPVGGQTMVILRAN